MQGDTQMTLEAGHPAFAGHFPGRPMVPGVLLLDAALHAIIEASGLPVTGCRIASTKFLSPVLPGETLTISYSATANATVRFDIAGPGRAVATGSLVLETEPGA